MDFLAKLLVLTRRLSARMRKGPVVPAGLAIRFHICGLEGPSVAQRSSACMEKGLQTRVYMRAMFRLKLYERIEPRKLRNFIKKSSV